MTRYAGVRDSRTEVLNQMSIVAGRSNKKAPLFNQRCVRSVGTSL
ncbi:hypothetical protein [Allorhodopirellula heiligendammensis]|nr:hypothetical protein [Allorhodopirellula heiligendammensis]